MVTKMGNIGNWFNHFDHDGFVSPVGEWMKQFSHIENVTQVNFDTWADLVGTVTMAGLQISDHPMIAVDSEIWK